MYSLAYTFTTTVHTPILYSSSRAQVLVEFSDEEGFGRFLDLLECHQQFVNLKKGVVSKFPALGGSCSGGVWMLLLNCGRKNKINRC